MVPFILVLSITNRKVIEAVADTVDCFIVHNINKGVLGAFWGRFGGVMGVGGCGTVDYHTMVVATVDATTIP